MLIKSRHVICDSTDCFFMILPRIQAITVFYVRTLVYITIALYKIVVDKDKVVEHGSTMGSLFQVNAIAL